MSVVRFYRGEQIPLEMHKTRIVQKLNLIPVEQRLAAITEAGNNTFLLKNRDVYLDLLTDSGVNAMSDRQLAAMMETDDSYAGSETYFKLEKKIQEIFGKKYFLPAHQGRACEHILAKAYVKPGSVVPMNYHFTTTKAHIVLQGGTIEEVLIDEGLKVTSDHPFKGDIDLDKLRRLFEQYGADRIPFVRMEAGTNLIGGQPFSLANLLAIRELCDEFGIMLVLDASLLADNLYFIKEREAEYQQRSIPEITRIIADCSDIIYFSARKLGCARGGGICTNNEEAYKAMRELVTLYEGFLTYGGMSVREIEALAVGLEETMDEDMISHAPDSSPIWCRNCRNTGSQWLRLPAVWAAISMRGGLSSIFPKVSIRRGRLLLHSTLPVGSGGWSGGPSRKQGNRTERRSMPIWNWFAWPCRVGSLPFRKLNIRSTASFGFMTTVN